MKLANVVVTGFGERCNLVREGKMFVKDKAKISCRVGGVKYQGNPLVLVLWR